MHFLLIIILAVAFIPSEPKGSTETCGSFVRKNIRCTRNIATRCWCIMKDIPKTRKDNPNAKKSGGEVEHI